MDALSEALSAVRMTGAIFYHAECTAPWGLRVLPLARFAPVLAPGTERLVSYHLVTEGQAVVRCAAAERPVAAGDVLIFPHGDTHMVWNGLPSTFVESGASLERFLSGDLTAMRFGGGGAMTRFICGFFGCERHADKLFLAGLPPLLSIHIRGDAAGEWLERSIRYLVCEAPAGRPGAAALLSKMAEALFIETLRRYMAQLPAEQTGWLAGARDQVVGGVLAVLHSRPRARWTLEGLAVEVGASRSVLVERFTRFLGEPPLVYLARWRMQLAARLLRTTRKTVIEVTLDVGYESEAAFNRAFKREFGLPPAQYRKQLAGHEVGVVPGGGGSSRRRPDEAAA